MVRPAVEALKARLTGRPDTEHEQALVRIGIGLLLGLYLLPSILGRMAAGINEPHVLVWGLYLLLSLALFGAIVAWPGRSALRRFAGVALDVSMLTWCMVYFEERGLPIFLIYIWVTLANGFRFGTQALMVSLALSMAGFVVVLWQSEFWTPYRDVGVGLLIGFAMLTLYVRKLVTQLFDAIARAEAANQAKRRFISVVSHEMRTPLNAIIGMSDLMRDSPLNREQADMLQTLRSSSRMMLALVEDVLDFSKIEAGKLVLEKSDFDLHALVNSTCRIVAGQAAAKEIDFVVSIMPEVPHALRGDPHYLRQVLVNLAGNAAKFTERGSITVHVSLQAETGDVVRLKFSIRDTGIGIPPEAQARIFESFTQANESTTRRFGGTGLGTTIAKQLVELMGGCIGVESALGLGSTFWFELSLDKQPDGASAGAGELAGGRVLLVGFPVGERQPLEDAVNAWGMTAVPVADVEQGVARLVSEISVARPYHSALFYGSGDVMDKIARFCRAAPNPTPPAVLALSSEIAVERFAALSAGFSAVLELPFDKRLLFNVLHSVSAREEIREGVVRLQDYARRTAHARKLRILVADDNPTNREVLAKILERGGHAAVVVNDGEQALDAVERERYDVVILDRNMPGTGGIEALQAMRLMMHGRERFPIILLSADAAPEARQEALDAGADSFLAKPIEAARLLDEVQALASSLRDDVARAAAGAARPRQDSPAEVVNLETLTHLGELGSSPAFLEKLVTVFLADSASLLERSEQAVAARTYRELRSHLHAMKGSSASMGADRLTGLCTSIGRLSDSELRMRGSTLVASLGEELAAVRSELEGYVSSRRAESAG